MAEVRDEKTQWRRLDSANETHRNNAKTVDTSSGDDFDSGCTFSR